MLGDPAGETEPRGTNNPGKKIIIGIVIIIVIIIKVIPISSVKHRIAIRPPPPPFSPRIPEVLPRTPATGLLAEDGQGQELFVGFVLFFGGTAFIYPPPASEF